MVIRGQGPDITAALTANRRISGEVSSELEHLGLLDELHLQYYSTSKDAVSISATFAAQYSAK